VNPDIDEQIAAKAFNLGASRVSRNSGLLETVRLA
jgi:hypothetical protein